MPITSTNFHFKNQKRKYEGKVRDVYSIDDKLVMVATDRISAFDVILPEAIPFKGQVLNQIAAYFLEMTRPIVPNWLEAVPDANVSVGKACDPIPIEMVIRGYLAGHAWRAYRAGKRTLCGVPLPEGLRENDKLPHAIITPATKAQEGHDEDISRAEIIAQKIVSPEVLDQLEQYTHELFDFGTKYAAQQGLILVDTKYEFGWYNGELHLIDEVHTPDSSRYFYLDTYAEIQESAGPQRQLSKEFVRNWLIENDFQGKAGQTMPEMTPEIVNNISQRYIELYEQITGNTFKKDNSENPIERIRQNVENYFSTQ